MRGLQSPLRRATSASVIRGLRAASSRYADMVFTLPQMPTTGSSTRTAGQPGSSKQRLADLLQRVCLPWRRQGQTAAASMATPSRLIC